MIDIIVPVLGRPQNAELVYTSFAANTVGGGMTFVCSAGDDKQIAACRATGAQVLIHAEPPGPGNYAKKINAGFAHTEREFVFMGADDIQFTPRWADIALRMMKPHTGVVATNDMANRQVMRGEFGTHNLIRRSYIVEQGGTADDEPGVVLWEGYDHNFVDRELCDVARSRGAFAFAKQSVVKHHHPVWKTAPWDTTYRKALAKSREDQVLYMARSPLFKTRKRDIVR